jgi:hypothetical protein
MALFDSALSAEIYPGLSEIALPFVVAKAKEAACGALCPQDFDGANVAR